MQIYLQISRKNPKSLAYVKKKQYLCSRFGAKSSKSMKIILAILSVSAALLLLSVGVLFRKDHSFRSQHIHENERMKRDKIHCAVAEDQIARKRAKTKMKIEN